MYTLNDYLKYYNNISFEESPFNDMDNIAISTLVYLPFEKILSKDITVSLACEKALKYENELKESKTLLGRKAFDLLKVMASGKRYKDIILSNYVNVVNETVQFTALTFRFNSSCYVAFCGTDNSIVGWKENFNLAYMYPNETQKQAINYLKETIKANDKVIYVGGHSKGGNLAMASSMEACDDIFNRIKVVYNNDGPGFLEKEFTSKKYQKLSKKLNNILPEESMVGILLDNKNYHIVKSSQKGPYQHDLTTWLCFGPFLVNGTWKNSSKKLQRKLNNWTLKIDDDNKKVLVDTFFDVIEESGIKHFWEVRNLKWPEISLMIKEAKNIDESSKKLLLDTLKELIEIDLTKEDK